MSLTRERLLVRNRTEPRLARDGHTRTRPGCPAPLVRQTNPIWLWRIDIAAGFERPAHPEDPSSRPAALASPPVGAKRSQFRRRGKAPRRHGEQRDGCKCNWKKGLDKMLCGLRVSLVKREMVGWTPGAPGAPNKANSARVPPGGAECPRPARSANPSTKCQTKPISPFSGLKTRLPHRRGSSPMIDSFQCEVTSIESSGRIPYHLR